jgi:hypothetical protein
VKFLDLQQIVPADNLGNYEIKKGFSKGLINKEGDELIPCDFSSLTLDIQNNYLCSTEKGKQIFFPTCTTFSKIYTNISPNATSYLVEQHDLFGLLNQQ